jgi:hypothetical protein
MDENRAYEMTRYVSKNGDMGLVSQETIQWAHNLPKSDKVALYCRVRDDSLRLESEWRKEFVERVGIDDSELPEPADEGTDLREFLLWAAAEEDRGGVMDSLEEFLEEASEDGLALARKLIEQTSQTDLLLILEEYETGSQRHNE